MTPSTPRASDPTAEPLVLSAPVLERFLSAAAWRGERAVAIARLVISVLGLLRTLAFGGLQGLLDGSPKYLLVTGGLLFGIAWSIFVLFVHRRPRRNRLLGFSVVADAALLLMVGLSISLWPSPTYPGLLRIPESGLFLLAMATPGLRLSRAIALLGAAAGALVQLTLIVVDFQVVPGRITYGTSEFVLWGAVNLGALVLGLAMATNARRLVFNGAAQAVRAERARQRLGLYVSEEVAREALESDVLEIGGRRQHVAVLFSDLRNFTQFCDDLPPEQVVAELNEYLDTMMRVIRDHGGVVDKFIGDSIMAVFGIPNARDDAARRSIETATAMQAALSALNVRRAARGLTPLRHGIGVHYGEVVAGNIGNAERLQYTVVGSVVNLASRLEAASKTLGVPVVISADTALAASASGAPMHLTALGTIDVRGLGGRIEVVTPGEAAVA